MVEASLKARPPSAAKPDAAVTLAAAHARLAQWALAVYVGTAIVIGALLVAALVTEMAHDEDQLEAALRSASVDHSYTLRRYLDLLSAELSRLGSRSEIQSEDNDDSPERKLLELSHKGSTLFDVGVAILDRDGSVVWSEPRTFLGQGTSLASEPWFPGVRHAREASIVPVSAKHADSLLYVVAPALQSGAFGGVVLGAIDLNHRALARAQDGLAHATTLITRRDGRVVYPPVAPDVTRESAYKQLFARPLLQTESARLSLAGEPYVIAATPLPGTELVYVLMSDEQALFGNVRQRLAVRLALGVALVVPPLWMLVLVLRRALRVFRRSEQEAVERERLQLLADASNLIAHEVRNALNGLGVGLDLLLQGDRGGNESRQSRIVRQLRDEMQRLSEFTGELMLFSKGIVPHPVRLDLADCVPKLTELSLDLASEAGCAIDVQVDKTPVWAFVDPALLRVVLGNLIGNALDVLAAKADPKPGTVRISLDASEREAKLRVVDDGPGIPDDLRRHLFEPFQTTKPSGTGLGLALSRRIARAHGGDLVLESSKSGASFLLTLPSEAAQ
jgi:signal transduction histidine kinase